MPRESVAQATVHPRYRSAALALDPEKREPRPKRSDNVERRSAGQSFRVSGVFDWPTDAPKRTAALVCQSTEGKDPHGTGHAGLNLLSARQQNPMHNGGQMRIPR
jgi:hypothetical protein